MTFACDLHELQQPTRAGQFALALGDTAADSAYQNPLISRYASKEMSAIFSAQNKVGVWRRLWLALAETQKELGVVQITDLAIEEMRAHLDDINFAEAEEFEKQLRHDVMSHIKSWGLQCPNALKTLHLGATSSFLTDNGDLIQFREAMRLVHTKLVALIAAMSVEAKKHRSLPTLGYTHAQPAQLTTVGKRICLWIHDLIFDYYDLVHTINDTPFRGVKGATGTQASFLTLFNNDHDKVLALDEKLTKKAGFSRCVSVSGQTYTRKIDFRICSVLSGIAQSAHKMCTDLRLLASFKEIEEPFGREQIGSSAMPYKRNPVRCERVCSIARHVNSLVANTINTSSTQWLERTLDDSANRRICMPEAFLGVDALLDICRNVFMNLQVWPKIIEKRVAAELPFIATEKIILACVKTGQNRQTILEAIRQHAVAATWAIKHDGANNDLLHRIKTDPLFASVASSLNQILEPIDFVGRAPEQVDEFLHSDVIPIISSTTVDIDNMKPTELRV